MAQKKRFRDPMKYKSEQIQSGPIYITRTHKEKHTKRMDMLAEQHYQIGAPLLQPRNDFKKTFDNLLPALQRLSSEKMAIFLIANNIARRGKLLHASTAIKKLEKMQCHGSILALLAIMDIKTSKITNLTFAEYEPIEKNLHYFLYKKYGVMLLNASAYDCCTKQIDKYKSWGKYGADKLHHYENFAKKFYKSDIQLTR